MALSKASSAHPVVSMRKVDETPETPTATVTTLPPAREASPDPAPKARTTARARTSRSRQARRTKTQADAPAPAAPSVAAPTAPASDTAQAADDATATLKIPTLPSRQEPTVESVATRSGVTLRGKRETSLLLPVTSLDTMQAAYRSARSTYRSVKTQQDPGGNYRLTRSAFLGRALDYALDHPGDWVADIPNDARNTPADRVPRKQIGLHWTASLVDRFHESWEVLEAEVDWPAGFTLTKANLAGTGILWALGRVGEWLADTPNDDRFSEPVAGDGRLRRQEPGATRTSF